MTTENKDRLLNIASVFVWNHEDEFINDYATDQMMFGVDRQKAYANAEEAYEEIVTYIENQL